MTEKWGKIQGKLDSVQVSTGSSSCLSLSYRGSSVMYKNKAF